MKFNLRSKRIKISYHRSMDMVSNLLFKKD